MESNKKQVKFRITKKENAAATLARALSEQATGSNGQWLTLCPSHVDTNPSLSVSDAEGYLQFNCHSTASECTSQDILEAIQDLGIDIDTKLLKKYPNLPKGLRNERHGKRYVDHWTYYDEEAFEIGHVVRYESPEGIKEYAQYFNYKDGKWKSGVPESMKENRPLYDLDLLIKAPEDKVVYVVEGEKVSEALKEKGFISTCSPGGASAASKADWTPLVDRDLILWPDNDRSGWDYMTEVYNILKERGSQADIQVGDIDQMNLKEKEDAFDFIEKGASKQDIENMPLIEAESVLETSDSLVDKLERVMYTSTDFLERRIPVPEMLLNPWLREQSITLVYGPRGVGKSWFAYIIATVLTRQNARDIKDLGSWSVSRQSSVLYVDGEMDNYDIQSNLDELSRPLPEEDPHNQLHIISGHDYSNQYNKLLNLDQNMRNAVYELLHKNPEIKVVILDNISALFPGLDENSKADWDHANQWLVSIRHLGVSVIVLHHANKEGKQRGTSGREDAMNNIIKVSYPTNYNQDEDYAWFRLTFEKHRNLRPGASKKGFALRIVPHKKGGLTWEVDEEGTPPEKKRQLMEEILEGRKQKDIAEEFNVSPGYVSQIKKECLGLGYIEDVKRKGKTEIVLTEKGEAFLDGESY